MTYTPFIQRKCPFERPQITVNPLYDTLLNNYKNKCIGVKNLTLGSKVVLPLGGQTKAHDGESVDKAI